ncbi:uncharacterized protein LOC117114512 isoform X2 [Anneissia japonica]|uniref:uncharacterized protein LOC117114512 isoform X2 n=1 Tax=Anneissia japonica TaxID=1529436 RepID=UPI001425B41F|nr:uncharacterized protein LOC117114512 isoform X2 [Anneissia japonica]
MAFVRRFFAGGSSAPKHHKVPKSQNRQQPPSQQPPVLPEKESKGHHGANGGSKQNAPQQQAEIIDFLYDVPPTRKSEDGESQRSNKSNTAGRKGELDTGCEDYAVPKGASHQDYAVPRTTRATSHSHGSGSKGHKSDKHGSRARSNTAREDRKVNRKSKANTTHHDKYQNDKQSDTDNTPDYDDGDVHVSIEDILSESGGNAPHDVRRKTFTGIRPSEQKSNHKENGGVSSEMQRLKHENTKLKKELQDSKRHSEKDNKKMREMESEIRRLKQREAEDAKALETMVQHVEDNLRRTTDRAVAAESHVSKLKQEIKHLKSHIHHMQSEPKSAPPEEVSNGDLGAIRVKAQATSLKLASLSRDAEHQLKQLLSGVETLKVVAETLACIDKVVEDSDSRHSTAL